VPGLHLDRYPREKVFVICHASGETLEIEVQRIEHDDDGRPFVRLGFYDPDHRFEIKRPGFVRRSDDLPPRTLFPPAE
jgi:hypothetical protein